MSPFADIESSTYFDPVRNFKTSYKDISAQLLNSLQYHHLLLWFWLQSFQILDIQ